MSRATVGPLWLWLFAVLSFAGCCWTGYRNWRLQADLDAERRFSQEKVASLLSETARLEEALTVARLARHPTLVSFVAGVKQLDVSHHNTLLLTGGGLPAGTRLSSTIFDAKGVPVLTHPTLSVQAGNVVVYPLPEAALKPGDYTLKLFHEAKVIATHPFTAR